MGQFYQEKSHLVPNEVLIPQDIDEEAVKVLVDTKILKPQRGEKTTSQFSHKECPSQSRAEVQFVRKICRKDPRSY